MNAGRSAIIASSPRLFRSSIHSTGGPAESRRRSWADLRRLLQFQRPSLNIGCFERVLQTGKLNPFLNLSKGNAEKNPCRVPDFSAGQNAAVRLALSHSEHIRVDKKESHRTPAVAHFRCPRLGIGNLRNRGTVASSTSFQVRADVCCDSRQSP